MSPRNRKYDVLIGPDLDTPLVIEEGGAVRIYLDRIEAVSDDPYCWSSVDVTPARLREWADLIEKRLSGT